MSIISLWYLFFFICLLVMKMNGNCESVPVDEAAISSSPKHSAKRQYGLHFGRAVSPKTTPNTKGETMGETSNTSGTSESDNKQSETDERKILENEKVEKKLKKNKTNRANGLIMQECKTMATLRDYLFVGDETGQVFAWVWSNWYNVDWRRVNRRRRRASLGRSFFEKKWKKIIFSTFLHTHTF